MAKWAPIRLGSAVDLLLSSVHRKQWGALSFSSWHEQELRCLRANHVLSIKARGSGRAKLISPNCTVPATGHIKLDNTQRKVSQHQGLIHPFRQVVASFQSRSPHDTLIASTNVQILFPHVHSASNVGTLLVDAH